MFLPEHVQSSAKRIAQLLHNGALESDGLPGGKACQLRRVRLVKAHFNFSAI